MSNKEHNIIAMKQLNEEQTYGDHVDIPISVGGKLDGMLEDIEGMEYELNEVWMQNDMLEEDGSSYLENLIRRVHKKLGTLHRDIRQMNAEWEALGKKGAKANEYGEYSKPVPPRSQARRND